MTAGRFSGGLFSLSFICKYAILITGGEGRNGAAVPAGIFIWRAGNHAVNIGISLLP